MMKMREHNFYIIFQHRNEQFFARMRYWMDKLYIDHTTFHISVRSSRYIRAQQQLFRAQQQVHSCAAAARSCAAAATFVRSSSSFVRSSRYIRAQQQLLRAQQNCPSGPPYIFTLEQTPQICVLCHL